MDEIKADMKAEIKAGDVVRLKSGGPAMTVGSVAENQGRVYCYCLWFDQNDVLSKHEFYKEALKLVKEF